MEASPSGQADRASHSNFYESSMREEGINNTTGLAQFVGNKRTRAQNGKGKKNAPNAIKEEYKEQHCSKDFFTLHEQEGFSGPKPGVK